MIVFGCQSVKPAEIAFACWKFSGSELLVFQISLSWVDTSMEIAFSKTSWSPSILEFNCGDDRCVCLEVHISYD